MANRNQRSIYCFIYNDAKQFYRAVQLPNGSWNITKSTDMFPIRHNPKNLIECPVEFSTNKQYFSMNRSINYPLDFTFDGAAILNSRYHNGKGVNENLYFAMFEWDSEEGKYKLSYNGKFDFQGKRRDEKLAIFTVSVIDDSGWGILSHNDDVEYAIDCSENNPKTVKVLIDDFTLNNRYTYQTVESPISRLGLPNSFVIPFVLVNQDGDSSGLVSKSQTFDQTPNQSVFGPLLPNDYVRTSLDYFLYSFYAINNVRIQGTFVFTWSIENLAQSPIYIFFRTSEGQSQIIFQLLAGSLIPGHTYNIDFDFTWNLAPGEKVFFMTQMNAAALNHFTINPITTNIFVSTVTKAPSTIVYGLRPLDLLKSIVQKATLERYTIDSNFFEVNNKTVLVPGDNFRGIKDGKIYTTFRDFFESFSALFFMALRVVNGSLFMELADEVYKRDTNIVDLGEIIECETSAAIEYMPNELEVGSPKQDYRHPSGRLEFNAPMTFSFPFTNIKNKLSLISKYRTDCYGMIFLILDYLGLSTKDNSGDKSVFIVDITDVQGSSTEDVETFENINVNNAPLAPIIKHPLTGDIINNDKPFLKGVGIPGTNVNIYIDDVLDGGTVVDAFGNWTYQIVTSLPSYDPGVFDGISVINATNTDMGGALDTIQLLIDTTVSASTGITYPRFKDNLYNNKPLIKGVASAGTNIDIFLDGVLLASVVTDNSCKFEYKVVAPITNGTHILDLGLGVLTPITVNSFTAFPLITYIGSELDGFVLVNNLPLIEGVGIPGTQVFIWLNYISYAYLGTTFIDANGNWSFQTIPVTYADPISGLPIVLAPIRNGLSVVSTLLINNSVKIGVNGYKLNRPAYNSITGVTDNTVFNTRLSNKRALMNHKSLLSAIMNKQRNDLISYQTHNKNSNLRTVLGIDVVVERQDISPSSLGTPIALLEYANIKVISQKTFAKTLYDFNNGGAIKGKFKGKEIFMLPIGNMKMKSLLDDVQVWKLLISPQTTYNTLLNLYKNGLTINLMENAIFHSDNNTLHFVEYNYTLSGKYNFKNIYQDWFDNRNSAWLFGKTDYIQKLQTTDILIDQVITNGISSMTLRMYTCKDAKLVDTFNYEPVNPAPIPTPEIVLEVAVDLSDYPSDQYFFVMMVGETIISISERIETRVKWLGTILIESHHSLNSPGCFYSTGWKTIIRVEGLVKKLQPNIDIVVAKEESGDTKLLYSQMAKKRMIRYGTARGLPDYLALKVAAGLVNDNCMVDGDLYTLNEGEKIDPSEDTPGVPLYYYNVIMTLQDNSKGKVFAGGEGSTPGGVILVVDASGIGIPTDQIIMIDET